MTRVCPLVFGVPLLVGDLPTWAGEHPLARVCFLRYLFHVARAYKVALDHQTQPVLILEHWRHMRCGVLRAYYGCFLLLLFFLQLDCPNGIPQWGAADAEIKVPSVQNTELKGSPFKAWSSSVYSHACCAYCQGFLPR